MNTNGSKSLPYDLAFVAEYAGLNSEGEVLPQATRIGLALAANLFLQGKVNRVAWGNSEFPGPGAEKIHEAKLKRLHGSIPFEFIVSVVSNNTVQEVRRIHDAHPRANRILIICDKPHAVRYKYLVQYFYGPDVVIDIETFTAKWNENHPSPFQRSTLVWRGMNLMMTFIIMAYEYTGNMDAYIKKFEGKTHMDK